MTLIRELINIPEVVNEGDFVLKLTSGVDPAHAAETVRQYVVTKDLEKAFDEALGLIASSVGDGESRAVYLHGSFGSGKSHFMAILHLLLQGDDAARGKSELHAAIANHEQKLTGKKFLLVPMHFLTARSMESAILGGYVKHVRAEHPGSALPAVFLSDSVLDQNVPNLRLRLGEEAFIDGLNGAAGGDDDAWGEFAASWTTDRVDAALDRGNSIDERSALAAAFIAAFQPGSVDTALSTGEGYINLDDGLSAISVHAESLGYDGIVLFLDELILWLASSIGDLNFVHHEAQKLAKLVESSNANRPVPIVSFVARQRDLSELVGDAVVGAELRSFADTLQLMAGRFGQIPLEDRNLAVVARRRLLEPVDTEAEVKLRRAVDDNLGSREDIRRQLLTSDADLDLFREVYPFSPALVQALVAVSEALQRERTALKVMLHLLVDQRNHLELGQFVPVGDLWDVVASSDQPFSADLKKAFERAKNLYRTKLRPMLMADHKVDDNTAVDSPLWRNFVADDRIIKTLLLAALVERVPAFADLDASRLVALNWGNVRTPIPGQETQVLANKLSAWSGRVGELKVGEGIDPLVSIALVDVDTDAIIENAARAFDNTGGRRKWLRSLIVEQLTGEISADLNQSYKLEWRGTEREVDIVFGNLRDTTDVPDAALRLSPGRSKLLIDFPFDESGHTPEEDLERLDRFVEHNVEGSRCVCWMPSFLNAQGLAALRAYVTLSELFTGGRRFDDYTQHLSTNQKAEAKLVLENRLRTLKSQLVGAVKAAYGVTGKNHPLVDTNLTLADNFRSLDPAMNIRPTTQPEFGDALNELCDQMLSHIYPGHPKFDQKVTPAQLKTTWEEVQRALGDQDGRVTVEGARRSHVRNVANALELGTMHESHFVLGHEWAQRLDRFLDEARSKGSPLTVGELRGLVDQQRPDPKGMPDNIADLVVLAVAAQTSHAIKRSGLPVSYEGRSALPSDAVLEPQSLPSPEEWALVRERVSAFFGLNPSPMASAPAIAELGSQLRVKAEGSAKACDELVRVLRDAYAKVGLDSGDRLRTAEAAAGLLGRILHSSDVQAMAAVADVGVPTSGNALGRSISTAREVAGELERAAWRILLAAGEVIVEPLRSLLEGDEFAKPLDAELRELNRQAEAIVVPPELEPDRDPTPRPAEVSHRVTGLNVDSVLDEIREAAEQGPIRVSWTREGGAAS